MGLEHSERGHERGSRGPGELGGGACGCRGVGGPPGAKTSGAQAHEDGADELAKGRGVDGLQLLLLAVQQVVAVEGAPRQAHPLCRLIVVQQPLNLGPDQGHKSTENHFGFSSTHCEVLSVPISSCAPDSQAAGHVIS